MISGGDERSAFSAHAVGCCSHARSFIFWNRFDELTNAAVRLGSDCLQQGNQVLQDALQVCLVQTIGIANQRESKVRIGQRMNR